MLSMTTEEHQKYFRDNQKAMLFLNNAVDDYIAARCLLINGLFPGLVLAAQSVEKYFKGYILLLDKTKNPRKFSHNITDLKNEIQALRDFKLDQYNDLLERLEKHYLTRYPDNKDASSSLSTSELSEIDQLVIHLNENLPVPDEAKFRSGLYVKLFLHLERGMTNMLHQGTWALQHNLPLTRIYTDLERKYHQVREHLYPSVNN